MKRSPDLNKNIPPGKQVKIYPGPLNDETIEPIETLMLKDSFTLPISAEYTSLGNSSSFIRSTAAQALTHVVGDSALGNLVKGLVGGLNTRLGFQVYSTPRPISISINCSLMAITDSWKDVVNPVRRIQKLLLPKEQEKTGFLIDYPGIDPVVALTGDSSGTSFKDASVRVGRIGFNHVVFKDVSTTFSTEVDQKGFPIQADISLTFETSFFATQGMLDEEVYQCTEEGTLKSDSDLSIGQFGYTAPSGGIDLFSGVRL